MVPDHPTIKNCENTDYPDGRDPQEPMCPRCGKACEIIYYNPDDDDIIGCENCVEPGDAWDEPMCF